MANVLVLRWVLVQESELETAEGGYAVSPLTQAPREQVADEIYLALDGCGVTRGTVRLVDVVQEPVPQEPSTKITIGAVLEFDDIEDAKHIREWHHYHRFAYEGYVYEWRVGPERGDDEAQDTRFDPLPPDPEG